MSVSQHPLEKGSSARSWMQFLQARHKLKHGRGIGADGASTEFIRGLNFKYLVLIWYCFLSRFWNETSPGSWRCSPAAIFPKTQGATAMSDHRHVCLDSVFSNWYGGCLLMCMRPFLNAPTWLLGQYISRPGVKCTDLTLHLLLCLEKARAWGLPLCILKLDIHKAFDTVYQSSIANMFADINLPEQLSAAFLWEAIGAAIIPIIRGIEGQAVRLKRGIRQGRPESMDVFVSTLSHALQPLILSWKARGFGFTLPSTDGVGGIGHREFLDSPGRVC